MIKNLAVSERRSALLILGVVALVGLAMVAVASGDPMGVHGFIVLLYAGVLFFIVGQEIFAPEPPISRLDSYYDDPTKVGIILALFWAVVGMFVGVWVAASGGAVPFGAIVGGHEAAPGSEPAARPPSPALQRGVRIAQTAVAQAKVETTTLDR